MNYRISSIVTDILFLFVLAVLLLANNPLLIEVDMGRYGFAVGGVALCLVPINYIRNKYVQKVAVLMELRASPYNSHMMQLGTNVLSNATGRRSAAQNAGTSTYFD